MVEPVHFRYNRQTGDTNVFQTAPSPEEEVRLSALAVEEHRQLRELLTHHGVTLTLATGLEESPDSPFCNNWFSTHPAEGKYPPTLVLYPLLAENRRLERSPDLVALLRLAYPRLVDFSPSERKGRFLESTGSLVLDHDARTAYAALSPRTDPTLAAEWARDLGYRLVTFTAVDGSGVPYYHTNVVMFIGHGLAGICLEAITSRDERGLVEERLRQDRKEILALTREQVANFCGNCLALAGRNQEELFVMSSQAWRAFTPVQRIAIERHGRIIHTELQAFERLGGGSARCLIAELF
jgi:hypothetical protein